MADERKIFVHNFTLKITSARARIRARLNKGPVVSLVEKNMGAGYKTSKYFNFPVSSPRKTLLHPFALKSLSRCSQLQK